MTKFGAMHLPTAMSLLTARGVCYAARLTSIVFCAAYGSLTCSSPRRRQCQ
jgi:hypothetical protein